MNNRIYSNNNNNNVEFVNEEEKLPKNSRRNGDDKVNYSSKYHPYSPENNKNVSLSNMSLKDRIVNLGKKNRCEFIECEIIDEKLLAHTPISFLIKGKPVNYVIAEGKDTFQLIEHPLDELDRLINYKDKDHKIN